MFANIGNLIKKLVSLFFVALDGTVKKIKELYIVGSDGNIHKIPTAEVEPWRAVLTTASYHYGTGGAYGSHVTNEDEPWVCSNNGSTAIISYTVTIPSEYVSSSYRFSAKLHTSNASISVSTGNRSGALFREYLYATEVSDGITIIDATNSATSTFTIAVRARSRASTSAPSEAWLTDVKVNDIPVKFYEE